MDQAAKNDASADEDKPVWIVRNPSRPDPHFGYSQFSIVLHWLTAAAAPILLAAGIFELPAAIVVPLALLVIAGISWRWDRGFARVADQNPLISALERIAIITIMVGLLMVAGAELTFVFVSAGGNGAPLDGPGAVIVTIAQNVRAAASLTLYGALPLGLLALLRHAIYRETGILKRMVHPQKGGY